MKYVRCLLSLLIFISCSRAEFKTPSASSSETLREVPLGPPMMDISIASSLECQSGGTVIQIFNDRNSNGLFDEAENLIRRQIVCNGRDGAQGVDGIDGTDGRDGLNMVFQTTPAALEECAAGGTTLIMALDSDRSGSLSVTDQNFQSLSICNGADGVNGEDGSDGADASLNRFSPIDVIFACGESSPYKEVLLRLQGGQVLASFSNNAQGDMTRLALLPDGTFMNTDNSGCVFSLSTSPDGATRSISWGQQVQSSWPLL